MVVSLSSAQEASDLLRRQGGPFAIISSHGGAGFRRSPNGDYRQLRFLADEIVEFSPADQVVVASAAMRLSELKCELMKEGQVIPLAALPSLSCTNTLGGSISLNLPHPLQGACGSWRDWVLGMTVVLANGDIVRCGSKAVKNVAGYDLHKLFIGARGTLGLVTEVVLRTFPLASFREYPHLREPERDRSHPIWIQRTKRSDFEDAVLAVGKALICQDRDSSTLWAEDQPEGYPRFERDWILRSGDPPEIKSETEKKLMAALKRKLDPEGKLNPGEFGFL